LITSCENFIKASYPLHSKQLAALQGFSSPTVFRPRLLLFLVMDGTFPKAVGFVFSKRRSRTSGFVPTKEARSALGSFFNFEGI
jgi:hypothetical protein